MLNLPPLYPITDARLDLPLSEQVRRLGEAGFPLVQFRGTPLDAKTQWDELRKALKYSFDHGGWPFICVNDRADLAERAAQERLAPWGLHLGPGDLPPSAVRELPGLGGLHFGASTYGPAQWERADPACDHAGCGPFRATATKMDHRAPIALEGLREGCAALRGQGLAPIAIGGLTVEDAPACFQAGAECLAMVGEVARAEDPAELLWRVQAARWEARPPLDWGTGLLLVGGSGSGKSGLARELAPRLGLPLVDSDAVVEAAAGLPVARIFAERGEAAFRELEARVLGQALQAPALIASGGGAWEHEAVRAEARRRGYTVLWMAEVPDRAWSRVGGDPARPLAQDRPEFMGRWRLRSRQWAEAPVVLPLGREAADLAAVLCKGL